MIQEHPRRAIVRLQGSNHEINISWKRCIPIYSTTNDSTTVIVTSETHHYRHLCASQIQCHEHVLEIGCSTGQASSIILKSTSNWIGFDVSNDMVKQTTNYLVNKGFRVQNRVYKLDVLKDSVNAETLIREEFGSPFVVFIDIGGNRDITSAIRVLHWCTTTFSVRLVVMKNREMAKECIHDLEVDTDGRIHGANEWFQRKMQHATHSWPQHPLQACRVLSPVDDTTPICRYHNYHQNGCKKANECPFDHDHCHKCRQAGHTAKTCPER